MRIRKALVLAIQKKKVRMRSWYPTDFVYCSDGRFWLMTNDNRGVIAFIIRPGHVIADDWEVLEP